MSNLKEAVIFCSQARVALDQITKMVTVCVEEHTKQPAAKFQSWGLDSVHSEGAARDSKVVLERGGFEGVDVHQVAKYRCRCKLTKWGW